VHAGLAPELRGAVVEQVEVVGVVAFLLDDLELDVLVVEIGGVGLGILVRKGEPAGEEEAGDLAGSEVFALALWLEAAPIPYS
ncbi:MAG TPA: hypothetical protein VMD08_08590, partial [Candidatus Baltobacteraceae bacterium]|nr:hypothetical protein [Candidatus Baltobacteraceae bacterium]